MCGPEAPAWEAPLSDNYQPIWTLFGAGALNTVLSLMFSHPSMKIFSMIVLDECHNAKGNNPYNRLLSEYMDEVFQNDGRRTQMPQVSSQHLIFSHIDTHHIRADKVSSESTPVRKHFFMLEFELLKTVT